MDKNQLPDLTDYVLIQKIEQGDALMLFLKKTRRDFMLDITGCMELTPEMGDIAIFWDKGKEWKAVVAPLADKDFAAEYQKYPYKASTQDWYENAVRFRNPDQLNKIINYRRNVAKKEQTDKNE